MLPVDPAAEGKRYLEEGLQLITNGDIDNAIEAFFNAAASFDRAQYFRQLPAIWEAVGNMLEPDFREKRKEFLEALKSGKINDAYNKWYQFPLVYRVHVASHHVWEKQKDPVHRQAWAYQWAAEHMEHLADHRGAYQLFLKAAEKAEQTKDGKEYPDWPARLWYRAASSYIYHYGTIDNEETMKAIHKMEHNYLKLKDKAKGYISVATAYRGLASRLMEVANLRDSEKFKRKECSALVHYYFLSGRYFRAMAEWLSGIGFIYFIVGWFVAILFIFPLIYHQGNLITSVQDTVTYSGAVLYSIESTLNIGHSKCYAVGVGELLNIIEAALSWLGLGVFIWWITRRLESM